MGFRTVSLLLVLLVSVTCYASAEAKTSPPPTNPVLSIQLGDADGDGIPDEMDPDDDNDGILDAHDPAPFDPSIPGDNSEPDPDTSTSPDADSDGDGVPNEMEPDDDGDGVFDAQDPAEFDPALPGPDSPAKDPSIVSPGADSDGDGIPDEMDPDDDNDGILDAHDASPFDPTNPAKPTTEPTTSAVTSPDSGSGTANASRSASTVPVVTGLPSTGIQPTQPASATSVLWLLSLATFVLFAGRNHRNAA